MRWRFETSPWSWLAAKLCVGRICPPVAAVRTLPRGPRRRSQLWLQRRGDRGLGSGRLHAGEHSYTDRAGTIHLSGGDVRIGRHTRIGSNTRLETLSDVADDRVLSGGAFTSARHKRGDVVTGDGVWIGVNWYIGPGVVIGNDAVIGANSVVTKSIPPGCVAAGIPARVIREKPLSAREPAARRGLARTRPGGPGPPFPRCSRPRARAPRRAVAL